MNHLLRAHAPISDKGWAEIDSEARERLQTALAARRLVDFSDPLGWEHSSTNLGRVRELAATATTAAANPVSALQRQVLPFVELRADFTLARSELAAIDRGAVDADFDSLDAAAHQIAAAENAAVLSGLGPAIAGVAETSPFDRRALGADPLGFAAVISAAVTDLRNSGVGGPYGLALSPSHYELAAETAEAGGTLLAKHLGAIVGGSIVWTPGIEGGVVLSQRGGDFLFECGQDLSVGYDSHDGQSVSLYLQESFSFRVATPEAAVVLSA
jgi:uncharacterized linocin/CFP29 family protein